MATARASTSSRIAAIGAEPDRHDRRLARGQRPHRDRADVQLLRGEHRGEQLGLPQVLVEIAIELLEIAERLEPGLARALPLAEQRQVLAQLPAARIRPEREVVIQRPALAVERIEPLARTLLVGGGVEQLLDRDLARIGQLARAVLGRHADLDPAVRGELGRSEELRRALAEPARRRRPAVRDQEVVRIFVQQRDHRKVELAAAPAVDLRHEGHRAARARHVEPADIARVLAVELLHLAHVPDHVDRDPVRRARIGQVVAREHFHRLVIELEPLGKAADVLLGVVGIDDEIGARCLEPPRVRDARSDQRQRRQQITQHSPDSPHPLGLV